MLEFSLNVYQNALQHIQSLQQIVFIRSGNGYLHIIDAESILRHVDIGDVLRVDDVVSMHTHKIGVGQLAVELFKGNFGVVSLSLREDGAIVVFYFNPAYA
jgi:hypothetical protein